ncbi:MAG: ribosome silencing factor [Bacteroidetes bacterium]|nr:ribosome silencing factor [Bacteroidota bacterium]MBP6314361.1 ribosome silencing factor [Chitinophagaceae bacterium]
MLKTVTDAKAKQKTRLTTNSKIIKTIIAAIQEKKGTEVISLNLKKIPEAVADFFVICEANNPNLVKAIADNVEKRVQENCGEKPYKFEGKSGEKWILIDYVDVVVHCMMSDVRGFYNLEDLWQDAEKKEYAD